MKLGSILGVSSIAVGILAASAGATTVQIPVFSTGSNGTTLITAGTNTPADFYTVTGPAGSGLTGAGLFVPSARPTAWLANDANSEWVTPAKSGNSTFIPGLYTYSTSFTLGAGDNLSTGNIQLEYTGDNTGTEIIFNGVPLGDPTTGGNTSYTHLSGPFTINSGFVDGTNTLEFVINNQAPTNTPEGLRVWIQSATISTTSSVVPEPSSVASFTVAGLLLGGLVLRGRRRVARNKA
jgi:hypothetical protein